MPHPYQLSLARTVALTEDGPDLLLLGPSGKGPRLANPSPAQRHILQTLAAGGKTADELCATAPPGDLATYYYHLARLEKAGLLRHTLAHHGQALATLEPTGPAFRLTRATPGARYRLSRFACLHRVADTLQLHSPLGHARILLHHPSAAALAALLAQPASAADLAAAQTTFDQPTAAAFLDMLHAAHAAHPCDAHGHIAEDRDTALRQWEFHDLLFHTRSRAGRHDAPIGGTYRFADQLPPTPAVKPPMSARRIPLHRPDDDPQTSQPFFAVIEDRTSQRGRSKQPPSAEQLGAFLYHSARIKDLHPAPLGGPALETSYRPCPSGGATHSLEIYLTITRCDGIPPGQYHYDPLGHALEHLTDLDDATNALLTDAATAAAMTQAPDILLTLAARFQRTAWKYQSIAYALILKDVGALYQQMYLVATALGLAPCALGTGDSDTFAQTTGLDYYTETSVGEFILSGAPA